MLSCRRDQRCLRLLSLNRNASTGERQVLPRKFVLARWVASRHGPKWCLLESELTEELWIRLKLRATFRTSAPTTQCTATQVDPRPHIGFPSWILSPRVNHYPSAPIAGSVK